MQAYLTQDSALALTLSTCGVKPFSDENGVERPFVHIYTAANLKKLGYRGMSIEAAGIAAVEAGKTGIIVYAFQRTDLCMAMVEAYFRHTQAIATSDESRRLLQTEINIDPIEAAKFGCQLLKNRRQFMPAELCKAQVPFICIEGDSTTEKEGDRTVTVGSMKLLQLNANHETRTRLGL